MVRRIGLRAKASGENVKSPIKNLRWYIGGLLFLSTVVNYIDRQTLSVLAPYLKTEYQLDQLRLRAADHRVPRRLRVRADGIGPCSRSGRHAARAEADRRVLLDRRDADVAGGRAAQLRRLPLPARRSASRPTGRERPRPSPSGSRDARAAGRWRCSTAARRSAERSRRCWCSGLYHTFGSWRPAFIVTGVLGFVWLLLFRWLYQQPGRASAPLGRRNARTSSPNARTRGSRSATAAPTVDLWHAARAAADVGHHHRQGADRPGLVLHHRLVRDLSGVERAIRLEESLLAFWIPFLAADVGNFAGGGLSSWLINRGWPVGAARKLVVVVSGLGMTLLIPTVFTDSYTWLVACFAIVDAAYAAFSTMVLNLPADIYPTGSVASVSGLSGTGAGIGTILATYADRRRRRSLFVRADPDRRQPDPAGRHGRGGRRSCGTTARRTRAS